MLLDIHRFCLIEVVCYIVSSIVDGRGSILDRSHRVRPLHQLHLWDLF
jgi:hypothetical protein